MIHFDTNYLINAVVPGTPQAAQYDAWVMAGETFGVSAMAWAEFLCGPVRAAEVSTAAKIAGRPIPVDEPDAARAAELFNQSGRRRGSLADCLIAAVALRVGAAVATENRADFAPFPGVRILP